MHENVISAQPDLHNIPVLYPHGTRLIWISTDGEICQLDRQAIAAELALGPVLLCHRRWSEARAGVKISNYLDIMELYAFTRPARFALPTPTGLAQQLGLARPQSGELMASLLPQIAFLLLDELAAQPIKEQTEAAKIADMMAQHGGVIGIGKLVHSYPHSWRSKAPVIYRNTAQWFVSMESQGLRDTALGELAKTAFYPAAGQKRLTSMIAQRPDWCLSRQRAWGVPLTIFVNKETGQPLRDPAVHARIVEAMRSEGADCWFLPDASRFLGSDYNADEL